MISLADIHDLEYLINHPKIYPSTGFPVGGTAQAGGFFDNPRNKAFIGVYGGMMFNHEKDDIYSGHFLFITGNRGTDIKRSARQMLSEMFTNHGASVIKGYPPRDNRAVRVIGIALGYHKINDANFVDDFGRECETYEVNKKWLL